MRYDLDDLRLFLHIVTEGSITAGAGRMHLSLPSASARVRSLEHHAGVALVIRGRRGVLAQTARLESAVASYALSATAPLTLLGGSSAMHRLVPQALLSFLLSSSARKPTTVACACSPSVTTPSS